MSAWEDIGNNLSDTLAEYGEQFLDFAPKVLVALVIFTIGSIVASALANLLQRMVEAIEGHKSVKSLFKKSKVKVSIARAVATFLKWIILFVFLSAAVDVLEIQVLTDTLNKIVDYMPSIFAAAVIAGVTFIGANVARELVGSAAAAAKVPHKNILSEGAAIAVWVLGVPLAMTQLGLDVSLINNNITVILGGAVAAAAIAFGIGGRSVAGSLLAARSTKDLVKVKQKIVVNGTAGTVTKVGKTAVVVKTTKGDMIVPFSRLMSESTED